MKALRFRVQNFRNINDSGWISLEPVTTFAGRNEFGKTTLLKAFHKFNRQKYSQGFSRSGDTSRMPDRPLEAIEGVGQVRFLYHHSYN